MERHLAASPDSSTPLPAQSTSLQTAGLALAAAGAAEGSAKAKATLTPQSVLSALDMEDFVPQEK